MLQAALSRCARGAARRRRLLSSSAAAPYPVVTGARPLPSLDEGDWSYYREWWGEDDGPGEGAQTVFRRHSECGNGVVSVVAYPASRPASDQWSAVERWLQERNARLYPESAAADQFKILGYQWRVMRFNDHTRQSAAKVLTCYRTGGQRSLYLMQQPHCLAVPYVKSMVSAGLTALASSYDLTRAASGQNTMKVLCIGHGGGSIPLFLASKIRGAEIHTVEIDPVVVSASVESMGFPSSSVKELLCESMQPAGGDDLLWGGIHDRIFLHIADAEDFIVRDSNQYDIVFIDAYDGDDIFPHKLWDVDGKFMKHLEKKVHPDHGTVVVNLHSDSELPVSDDAESNDHFQSVLPMGKHVSRVCAAYKQHFGLAFTSAVPWLCNITLVACRDKAITSGARRLGGGRISRRDFVLGKILSNADVVERALGLPFPCLQYVKNGFRLVD